MTAKYRKISVRIWSDVKIRAVSDSAQLLFLFILTHPHMSSVGAMRTSIPGIAQEKGWSLEKTEKGFAELFLKGLLKHDESACAMVAPNFIKHNPPENPNVVKAWRNAFDDLPECKLIYEHFQSVKEFLKGFGEGFREPFSKGMPNQEQEQEQDYIKENIKRKKTKSGDTLKSRLDDPALQSLFENFWQHWPNKRDKADALKAFAKLNPPAGVVEQMISAVQAQVQEHALKLKHGAWCPEWKLAATWINKRSFENPVNLNEDHWRNEGKKPNDQADDFSNLSPENEKLLAEYEALTI